CVSAVQFATGTLVDVAALVARARSVGARVVVDVTQMAGAVPVAMSEWGADALVCSGYKWLSAPGGVALLAITDDLAAAIPPLVGREGPRHTVRLQAAAARARHGRPAIRVVDHLLQRRRRAAHLHQTANRDRAGLDTPACQSAGGRPGGADRAARLGPVPAIGRPVRQPAHCLAKAPHRRGRSNPSRAGERPQDYHQLPRRRYPGLAPRLQLR